MPRSRQHQVQESDIWQRARGAADSLAKAGEVPRRDGFAELRERIRLDAGYDSYWRAAALFQLGGLPRRTAHAYLARHPGDPMLAVVADAARRHTRDRWRAWIIATGRTPAAADQWLYRDQRTAAAAQLARLRHFMGDDAYQPLQPLGWCQWERDPRRFGPLPSAAKVAGRRALRVASGHPLRRTGPGCIFTYCAEPDSRVLQVAASCIVEPLWVIQARTAGEDDALERHGFSILADELGVAHE